MKSWIAFGDLDLIFNVTPALKLLNLRQKKTRLFAYLMNRLAGFNQIHDMHNIVKVTAGHD